MRRFEVHDQDTCVVFTSEKCKSWVPAKTIFLFAPDVYAISESRLSQFAKESGWIEAIEEDGAVLIMPVARNGWSAEDTGIVPRLYTKVWRSTLPWEPGNEMGNIWCWETLIFSVGYKEGAIFAGDTAVAHPDRFAQVVMVDGQPASYDAGEDLSDHWLVPDAEDYSLKNCQVPVSVSFIGEMDTVAAQEYFKRSNEGSEATITVIPEDGAPTPALTREIMEGFSTHIRWKDSPNGTPARCHSKKTFYTSGEYIKDSVEHGGSEYDLFIRFPKGHEGERGLPVVFSLHGHGEPAWLFSTKNGWDKLSDETGEFILVLPDSPRNEWRSDRDGEVFGKIIEKLSTRFGVDRTRVYLTGFSNGAMATSWFGTKYPWLFAAISPWNSPTLGWCEWMEQEGWQLPMFAINGDKDHKIAFERGFYDVIFSSFIRANGGIPRIAQVKKPMTYKYDELWNSDNLYTIENGYKHGDRMETYVYDDLDGRPRVAFTEMRNMPHGAISDEARAAWHFMRRFSRPEGSKTVCDSTEAEPVTYERTVAFGDGHTAYLYVPAACNSYTPSRTMIILPQSEDAATIEAARGYIRSSGWARRAVKDASVLVIPLCPEGWGAYTGELAAEVYRALFAKVKTGEHKDYKKNILDGTVSTELANVWLWETLWNLIGYGDGAELAARCAVSYPNRFASVTLLGSATDDFSAGSLPSDHIHVSIEGKDPRLMIGVSQDYDLKNCDIPTAIWIVAHDTGDKKVKATTEYFKATDGIEADQEPERLELAGMVTLRWSNKEDPAQRVVVSQGEPKKISPDILMEEWIGESIRWKDSPDGSLATFYWRWQIETGKSPYIRETYRAKGETRDRDYYVYKPQDLGEKPPVVITIHGHGEPAWMFISKNGWPAIADREKILIVSPSDNDENRWTDEADTDAFLDLVEDICWRYGADRGRVYITGFSNGNMQCFSTASRYPELFAGMWAMSSPATGDREIERFASAGKELPLFATIGDNDGWNRLEPERKDSQVSKVIKTWLGVAGREPEVASDPQPFYYRPDSIRDGCWYRDRYGFKDADRFMSWCWNDGDGSPRVVITLMKDMPHGTVPEESVAAWDFLKRFRRNKDGSITEET